MVGSCTSHANSFVIGPAVINTHTLEFWVRFPNERNQGKQAHPVLKYRVPHGSQQRNQPSHSTVLARPVCLFVCVSASFPCARPLLPSSELKRRPSSPGLDHGWCVYSKLRQPCCRAPSAFCRSPTASLHTKKNVNGVHNIFPVFTSFLPAVIKHTHTQYELYTVMSYEYKVQSMSYPFKHTHRGVPNLHNFVPKFCSFLRISVEFLCDVWYGSN